MVRVGKTELDGRSGLAAKASQTFETAHIGVGLSAALSVAENSSRSMNGQKLYLGVYYNFVAISDF